jgi:hypothetical protein
MLPSRGTDTPMRTDARAKLLRFAPLVVATTALAYWSISAIRARTGGEPSVPLDDAFIHFRYARALAEGHPLVYSPGDPATSGATSLLWSALLAPFWKVGFRDVSLIWIAWALSFTSLALLAIETRRLAARLLPRGSAIAAGAMVLAFGGHVWCAGSGMEVIPFAFLLMRTARLCAELYERHVEGETNEEAPAPIKTWDELNTDDVDPQTRTPTRRLTIDLAICAALLPFARPEGAVVSLFAAVTLFLVRARRAAIAPLLAIAFPPLLLKLATGSSTSTTARVKWLLLNPYVDARGFWDKTLLNAHVLFSQLFDGKGPAKTFLPDGFFYAIVLSVPALLFAVKRRGHRYRALCIAIAALCIVIPATYDSFLANRLRYLWPFTAAWMIALAAIGDAAATLARRLDEKLVALRMVTAGIVIAVMAGQLAETIDDLAISAAGIRNQQVSLARWARDTLPRDALVAVNDAGAMAYLSDRRTFDVVGLTTRDEASHWNAGAASRFEHYERLAREGRALPTHFAVYPEWFEIAPVLGNKLTERTVEGATILGAPTMVAHEAAWLPWLGSSELPIAASGMLIDALDVADLASEAEHHYELLRATRGGNVLVINEKRIDGARGDRELDRFDLRLVPGGRLVLRVGTTLPAAFAVLRVDGIEVKRFDLAADAWQELSLDVPNAITEGTHRLELAAAPGQRFLSMHYWSYR